MTYCCVSATGGGGGGGGVCLAAGSGTTPEPRRATPLRMCTCMHKRGHGALVPEHAILKVHKITWLLVMKGYYWVLFFPGYKPHFEG